MNRRLLVDLEALTANYQLFQQAAADPAAEVGAVVKADAYGCGAVEVASRLRETGCASFFVASVEEGLALAGALDAGATVYVFEGPEADSAAALAAAGLIPVLNHPAQLEHWRPHRDRPIAVHVDTGMSRLGFSQEVGAADFTAFRVNLLLTHLACADEPDHPQNALQTERFAAVCERFPGVRTSIGNSAGWLSGAPRQGTLGRPGVGLYGGNPFAEAANPCRPVTSLQGRVLQLKTLAAGEAVGYGASHVTERPTRVAVVGLGYADGVPRALSGCGELALAGRRCPILGRVSMDVTVIDVTDLPGVAPGDWAECYGKLIGIDEAADRAGTISYELLTGVGPRVARIYQPLSA